METVTRTSFLWYLDCCRASHHSCLCSPIVLFPSPGILKSLKPMAIVCYRIFACQLSEDWEDFSVLQSWRSWGSLAVFLPSLAVRVLSFPANKINMETKLEISRDVTKETTGVHVTTPHHPPSPPPLYDRNIPEGLSPIPRE